MIVVLSICLAVMAIVLAWGSKVIRDTVGQLHASIGFLLKENQRINVSWEHLNDRVRVLNELLHAGVAIDVGLRDRGWLILCCRVGGQDRVMIQHLNPEMTPEDYKVLVKKLSYDFQHVAYIDAPHGYECFLRKVLES